MPLLAFQHGARVNSHPPHPLTPLVKFTPPARVIIIIVTKYCNAKVLIATPLISNLYDSLAQTISFPN